VAFLGRQATERPDLYYLQDFAVELPAVNPNVSGVKNAAAQGEMAL
jgi:hypothetical protein